LKSIVSDFGVNPEFLPEWRVSSIFDGEDPTKTPGYYVKASSAFKAKCAFLRSHTVESNQKIVVQFWKEADKLS
jgi:hypothetical protein